MPEGSGRDILRAETEKKLADTVRPSIHRLLSIMCVVISCRCTGLKKWRKETEN